MSTSDSCVFCRIVSGEIPSQKVWESERLYAFRDAQPQAPTHLLVVPRKHLSSLAAAGADDAAVLGELQLAAGEIARKNHLDSFRYVTNAGVDAGQSVFHLHYHLLAGRKMAWPPG
jgi:histidine triad (HIT) family protein